MLYVACVAEEPASLGELAIVCAAEKLLDDAFSMSLRAAGAAEAVYCKDMIRLDLE